MYKTYDSRERVQPPLGLSGEIIIINYREPSLYQIYAIKPTFSVECQHNNQQRRHTNGYRVYHYQAATGKSYKGLYNPSCDHDQKR